MMLKRGEVLSTLRNVNKRSLPIYYLEETIKEFGESHLEAFSEIDKLNRKIKKLESAIVLMGKSHRRCNCDRNRT